MKQRQQHLRSPAATVHPPIAGRRARAGKQAAARFRVREKREKKKNKKMKKKKDRGERESSSLVAANKQVVDHQVNS